MAFSPEDLARLNGEPARTSPQTGGGPLLDKCPSCSTAGPAVYVAAQHFAVCPWMQHNLHRCPEHDELLLPSETRCPHPDVPEEWADPHSRLGLR